MKTDHNGANRFGPALAVALDVTTLAEAEAIVTRLPVQDVIFKVGKQLFVSQGPAVVTMIQEHGGKCLLDLKFFDIPHTVEGAVREATRLGVWGMTLHTLGGRKMLDAARNAADTTSDSLGISPPRLFAVTLLTSMDTGTLKEIGFTSPMEVGVLHLADLALKANMDGIVASPLEAAVLRKALGEGFLIMTPGIRPAPRPGDDQRRIATPKEALSAGADLLVMGRSILDTPDPTAAVKEILTLLKSFPS